jgi:hypothetical protein
MLLRCVRALAATAGNTKPLLLCPLGFCVLWSDNAALLATEEARFSSNVRKY